MDITEPKDPKKKKTVRGKPFQKGQSGNPAGKRKGTRNAATLAAEALLDGESAALTRKLIAMANNDNMAAMRLVFERILPPRRERPMHFELPPLKTAEDAIAALARIADGVGQGELSDSEARTLVGLVHTVLEGLAQVENQSRLAAFESSFADVKLLVADLKTLETLQEVEKP